MLFLSNHFQIGPKDQSCKRIKNNPTPHNERFQANTYNTRQRSIQTPSRRDEKNQIQWQLVPPGNHRRNAAERHIRTFKNHFISILAGIDPDFLLHLWDKLIPQACITINLLSNSYRNPQLSAEHISMETPITIKRH